MGCALRFRWAPQHSGSCKDRQAGILFFVFPTKTPTLTVIFFLSTLTAVVTLGVSLDCSVRPLTVSRQLFSLASFSLRYSLYKSETKTQLVQYVIIEIKDIYIDQKRALLGCWAFYIHSIE